MKKGMIVLLVGAVLIVAAVGIFAISAGNTGNIAKKISVEPHQTKDLYYNLNKGNYTLVIYSKNELSYRLLNSSGIIIHEENVTQVSKILSNLNGNYTLEIENPSNDTAEVVVVFESQTSLSSLGTQVLSSGGICLTGIIVVIVGVILLLRERKRRIDNVR